jgi:hypothetical protein
MNIIIIGLLMGLLYGAATSWAKAANENHKLRATLENTLVPLRQINSQKRDNYLAVIINSADCVLKGIKDGQYEPTALADRRRV